MQQPAVRSYTSKDTFAANLRVGQMGESLIANWFKSIGYHVLPAYEKEIDTGKGPRFFTASRKQLVAPDMIVIHPGTDIQSVNFFWVEAKNKSAFTYNRNLQRLETGIDTRHFDDYCKVADETYLDVLLLFIQRGGGAIDNPGGETPAGLFGGEIKRLRKCVSHQWPPAGQQSDKPAMTYWEIGALERYASLEEVYAASGLK